MWERITQRARALKAETVTLWFCCRHPNTPLAAKALGALVVAYALSPIDLIPDFIPVLGYLDDIILLPIGIYLVLKMVPPTILEECRGQARAWLAGNRRAPRSYWGLIIVMALWAALACLAWRLLRAAW